MGLDARGKREPRRVYRGFVFCELGGGGQRLDDLSKVVRFRFCRPAEGAALVHMPSKKAYIA